VGDVVAASTFITDRERRIADRYGLTRLDSVTSI